jgi:hypothetical protein
MPRVDKLFEKINDQFSSQDNSNRANKLFETIDNQLSSPVSTGGPNDYNLEEVNILLGLSGSEKTKRPERPKIMKNSQMNSDGTVTLPNNPVKPTNNVSGNDKFSEKNNSDNSSVNGSPTDKQQKNITGQNDKTNNKVTVNQAANHEKNNETAENTKNINEMTEEEIIDVSNKINKKYMQKLLLEIANRDPYNIVGSIMCVEFGDIIKSLKTVLKNSDKDLSLIENTDFKFFASFVDAIFSESYEPFFRHYGKVDFSEKFKELEKITSFLTLSFNEHYAGVVIEYNKSGKDSLNKFFAPANSNHKITKCIKGNQLWYIYTVDKSDFKTFKLDTGVTNAVVRDKLKRTLWFYNAYGEQNWTHEYALPDTFNIYRNHKLPEYQSLSFLVKVLYHHDMDCYFNNENAEEDNEYKPHYKSFIKDIIDCFLNTGSTYENTASEIIIPDSLFNIISRYVSNVNFRKKPSFDHVTTSIFRTYIDTYDDEDFLSLLSDNDCLSDEILNLMSDIIKDTSLLSVHNAIISCLVKHLSYICKSSNETTKDMISYMLEALPAYDIYEICIDAEIDYAKILDSEIEKIKNED